MDPKHDLIICHNEAKDKDEIKTGQVQSCIYDEENQKVCVTFESGKVCRYNRENVVYLTSPEVIDPTQYQIRNKSGGNYFNINAIYSFKDGDDEYWYLDYGDAEDKNEIKNKTFRKSDLTFQQSCFNNGTRSKVFEYIKDIAKLVKLPEKDDESDETDAGIDSEDDKSIFAKKFDNIFVGDDVVLAKYLDPSAMSEENTTENPALIFPFGCNNSQCDAVRRAMTNQISVIEGPPGTGKTQTILNIIANVLMQDKTVLVVSNNNAATDNVYEKLAQYSLAFIVARLGSQANKNAFVKAQTGSYTDFATWKLSDNSERLQSEIEETTVQLKAVFDQQENLARLKQEQSQIEIEREHFKRYMDETNAITDSIKTLRKLDSNQWMKLWQECQSRDDEGKKITLPFRIKVFVQYGIYGSQFFQQGMSEIIATFQEMFYRARQQELCNEIGDAEKWLRSAEKGLQDNLRNQSMALLKNKLYERYKKNKERPLFTKDELWQKPYKVLAEYPVVTSTTFSSTSSLKGAVYDYLIMDEASQVDIATGALALSCAKNAVIVGDTKQLPNIVTDDMEEKTQVIFNAHHPGQGYHFKESFLQSVIDVIPGVEQTLLREHYRCHPKIINFCNQKFYRGELVIMTEDAGEDHVLAAVKTAPGNHERDLTSQRQIDAIKNDIPRVYFDDKSSVGIITPYRHQVAALRKEFPGIDVSTVHKFQGREKDTIIISTVDDLISEFVDDPYLINVAVSRAKKRLILIATGNPQPRETNIFELIDYIRYNKGEVIDSKVHSIFDYLYKQYTQARIDFLKTRRRVSEYDSENLMYSLIENVLTDDRYSSLDVICHLPLNMLIRDMGLLDERETHYAMNPATHVDFLIYNRISKRPVLAVEVDGYQYHMQGTRQASRDEMKNEILARYEIPLVRFSTTGSGEKEQLVEKLDGILG